MINHFGLWYDQPLVCIDFETTGLDYRKHKPIEVGVVRFEGGEEVGSFSSLLDPKGVKIEQKAFEVHGITDAECKGQPTLDEVYPQILRLVQDAVPVAYNLPLDRDYLHHHGQVISGDARLPAMSLDWPTWVDPFKIVVSYKPAREYDEEGRSIPVRNRLGDACRRYGISLENAHRAENDARATLRLLLALKARHKLEMTVSELIRRQMK